MKRFAAIVLIVLVAVVGAKLLWKAYRYPPVPEVWQSDFSGMYYDDARALLGEPYYSFGVYLGRQIILDTDYLGEWVPEDESWSVTDQFVDGVPPRLLFYDVWIVSSDQENSQNWSRLLVLEYCGGGPDRYPGHETRVTFLEQRDLTLPDLGLNQLGMGLKLC